MSTRFLGSTTVALGFFLRLTSDHITGATGKTATVTIRKEGGSFASPAGAVTEVGNGWYEVAADAADLDTLGTLKLHATASACDPADVEFEVIAIDPFSADISLNSVTVHNQTGGNAVTLVSDDAIGLQCDGNFPAGIQVSCTGVGAGMILQSANGAGAVVIPAGPNDAIQFAGDFQVLGSILANISGSITSVGSVTGSVGSVLGDVGGNLNGNVVGAVQGAVASVTGSVGSVVGNVGGNVSGSVGSIAGGITLSSAYDPAKTCAQASTALSNATWTNTIAGRLDAAISSRSTLTLSQVVNGILDELMAGHTTSGSVAVALRMARQFAVGKKTVIGNTLRVYAEDNATVLATLDLTPHGGPFTAQTP